MKYSKGQKVTYTKEIMFKGTEEVTAKIVAIMRIGVMVTLLLDNGDEVNALEA